MYRLCVLMAASLMASWTAFAQVEGQAFRFVAPSVGIGKMSLMALLKRPDVQNGIQLDLRQRNELQALLAEPSQLRVSVAVRGDASDAGRNAQQQAEEQIRQQLDGGEARIKAILRPEQWERLQQIRLQWQGPLALAEPEVAQKAELSAEHRSEIARIAAEYAAVKSEVLASLSQTREDASPDGTRRMVAVRLDTSELDKPFSPARKKLEKAKKEAERQILAVLSREERARWDSMCGKPFTFRTDLKGLRF